MQSCFRYAAVCKPFIYREVATPANVNYRVFKYLLIVTIFSVIVNFPRFFETSFLTKEHIVWSGNSTEVKSKLTFDVSALRKNPQYIR